VYIGKCYDYNVVFMLLLLLLYVFGSKNVEVPWDIRSPKSRQTWQNREEFIVAAQWRTKSDQAAIQPGMELNMELNMENKSESQMG